MLPLLPRQIRDLRDNNSGEQREGTKKANHLHLFTLVKRTRGVGSGWTLSLECPRIECAYLHNWDGEEDFVFGSVNVFPAEG